MLIQDNNNFINIDDIKDIFPEPLIFGNTDSDEIKKFIIAIKFNDDRIYYLSRIFDDKWQANDWISEIIDLQEFELVLRNYKL